MEAFSRMNLIGSSPQFRKVVEQVTRMAGLDATVLVAGETGTGKEVAARAIHYLGARCDKPFVPVNCGALAESLVESELFGHERGAFTDAKTASAGLIGQAAGGTIFLDEIDALTAKAQASLLRFLQDRTYRRVGGGGLLKVDVRVLVASNADLDGLARERRFRQDLLYRLNVLTLHLPPLRERAGDALELARDVLARLIHQYRTGARRLHAEGMDFIRRYHWPGNVRELENVIHREFLMSDEEELRLRDARELLMAQGSGEAAEASASAPVNADLRPFRQAKADALAEFERDYVRRALLRAGGNISQAARISRQERSAFGKLVRKYRLDGHEGQGAG
jgi:DNA-binding NtrC family response regulator